MTLGIDNKLKIDNAEFLGVQKEFQKQNEVKKA